jgi:hypothetical protein
MISETNKIIPLLKSANYGAGADMDSFKMEGHAASLILTFGAVTGNAVLKVYSGATAGAKTSAMPFKYAYGGGAIGAASADVLTAWADAVAASGLTLTGATYGSKMAVLHFNAASADVANAEEWITVEISSAASSGILHAVAVIENPRYSGNRSTTLLA